MRWGWAARLALAAALAAACSSSKSGGSGSASSAQTGCTDLAASRCAKAKECSVYLFSTRYGDDATCAANELGFCLGSLGATGTVRTADDVEACAKAFAASSCNDFLSDNAPAACLPKAGPTASGGACAFSSQCSTAYCNVPDGFGCGRCASAPQVGDPCSMATQRCGAGQFCAKATATCATPAQNGQSCDTDSPCVSGLSCVGVTATTHGICQPAASPEGAACDPKAETAPVCDPTKGLVCDRASKTCVKAIYAAAGQPCGSVGTAYVSCAGSGFCSIPSGQTQGTCVAASGEGGPCDTQNGPNCQYELRCVVQNGSSGVCHMPASSSCP